MRFKRRSAAVATVAQNNYQFPYISMMTLICMFFLMLYAYYLKLMEDQTTRQGKTIEEKVKKDIAKDRELAENVKVVLTNDGVKITMPSALVFSKGSARIQEWMVPMLTRLSATFRDLPRDYMIRVDGHTDDSPVWYGGDYSSNWELSLYRSLSIIRFLMSVGTSSDRFFASGFSQYRPLAANTTPVGRAGNRRVEITIFRRDVTAGEFAGQGQALSAAGHP